MNRWQRAVRKLRLATWDEPMLRPVQYEIVFDAPSAVYFAEQTVTGHVMLEMDQPVNLKGVKLRFKGECFIHFSDSPRIMTSKKSKKMDTSNPWKDIAYTDDGSGSATKGWKQLVTRKKNGMSVSPLLPSPSSSLDYTDEKTGPHCNGMGNGKINYGYVPDSALTTASGIHWTNDKRNGGAVHTPSDNMGMVNGVGVGHINGAASTTNSIRDEANKPPRQPTQPTRGKFKKKLSSEIDEAIFKGDEEGGPEGEVIVRQESASSAEAVGSRFSKPITETRDLRSRRSSVNSRLSIGQNNEGSSLDSDPDDHHPIFTVEEEIPNGGVHRLKPSGIIEAPGYFTWKKNSSMKKNAVSSKKNNHLSNKSISKSTKEEEVEGGSKRPRRTTYERPLSSSSAWRETTVRGPTYYYKAKETYFDCEFYIYGHKYQRPDRELLAPGTYKFPFAFNLPPNLPPSFASEKGVIRYMVAAILDRPSAANLVRKKAFNIHTILDLNHNSHAGTNISKSNAKNLCGLFCHSGPISLSVRIRKRGFVPGEEIVVDAEADNISGRSTKRTRLMLLQVITYIMPNKIKNHIEKRIVKEVVRGMIPPGESDLWEGVVLTVPPLAPNNLHINGRLMRLDYTVEMVMELPRPWSDLRVTLPIQIGSVPLRANFKNLLPQPETVKLKQPPLPKVPYQDFPAYFFGECFFGQESLESQYERLTGDTDDMGPQLEPVTMFAPSYISYTLGRMVHASHEGSMDTRPSSVVPTSKDDKKKSFDKISKTGSFHSTKGSTKRKEKPSRLRSGSTGDIKNDLTSKERFSMNVINKISKESDERLREWKTKGDARNVVIDASVHDAVPSAATDASASDTTETDTSGSDKKEESGEEDSKTSGAGGATASSVDIGYDFDREPKERHKVSRIQNHVNSTKFKAVKVISTGNFKSNKDFMVDNYSISTP